jgi:hypothetical protein
MLSDIPIGGQFKPVSSVIEVDRPVNVATVLPTTSSSRTVKGPECPETRWRLLNVHVQDLRPKLWHQSAFMHDQLVVLCALGLGPEQHAFLTDFLELARYLSSCDRSGLVRESS